MRNLKISRICRKAREQRGLSQLQLADMYNLSQQNISNFECGRNLSSRLLLIYISEVLTFDDIDEIAVVIKDAKNYGRNITDGCPAVAQAPKKRVQKTTVSGVFGSK